MAIKIRTVNDMLDYMTAITGKADHHARSVNFIIYPLVSLIIAKKDPDSDILVRQHNGVKANVLWAWIRSKRYAFLYDHSNGTIAMKRGGIRGDLISMFDNSWSIDLLKSFFESL